MNISLSEASSALTPSVPLWLQVVTIVMAPVLAFIGVGVGARLSRSGEELQWLRNSRLQVYSSFLLACNSYDVAARQLAGSLSSGDRDKQLASREDALQAIRDVITYQENVLLLGSPSVQGACKAAVAAIYAANADVGRLIAGTEDESYTGQALREAVTSFREAVRSELIPRRLGPGRSGKPAPGLAGGTAIE